MSDIGEFPENLIELLKDNLIRIPGVTAVVDRALGPEDADGTVGVEFREWRPVEVEMGGGISGFDPTLSGYVLSIEHLVKNGDRESGNKIHREVARGIRSMLYRDPEAQLAFRQLTHSGSGYTERLMKWELVQSFANNKIASAFYFVSGTMITFETETV